jgi:hypothetical protein
MFHTSPYLSDLINHNMVQSEIEGGVHLNLAAPESVFEIRTQNHSYTLVHKGEGQALISGHPTFCPEPVLVHVLGSTWGGTMLKMRYIGRGMRLEFEHPEHRSIVTSPILDIQERTSVYDASRQTGCPPASHPIS